MHQASKLTLGASTLGLMVYGFMVLMVMVLWFYGFMLLWLYHLMNLWFYSVMVLWFDGFVVLWFHVCMFCKKCQLSISCFQEDIDPVSKLSKICYAAFYNLSVPVFCKSGTQI